MKGSSKYWLALSLVSIVGAVITLPANSQGVSSERSSSSSTTSVTDVKGYAFKYKQRFDNYSGQIDMGVNKGWLTADQAAAFRTRLEELRSVESAAGHNGYPAADIAKLDKMTTKFNEDLSSSSTSKPASTTTETKTEASPAPKTVTKKVTTTKGAPKKTTTNTTVKRTVVK